MAVLPGIQSIPLQAPEPDRPIASYQPGILQQAQEQEGEAVAHTGAEATQTGTTIADAQDQINYAAAEHSFLGAKLQADQAAETDQDYATLPQRYTANMQQAAANAGQMINSPALRAQFQSRLSFMMNYGTDRIFSMAHAKATQADQGYLNNTLSTLSQQYAQAPDDMTRAALVQNGSTLIDGMAGKGSISAAQQAALKRQFVGGLTTSRAQAMVRTDPVAAERLLAPSGTTETGDPVFAPTQTWIDHIPPGQRAELYQQAQRGVRDNQQASVINQERALVLQQKQDAMAGEQAADGYIKQLTIDPTKVDPIAIANDPNIPASQWRTRASLINMAQSANGEEVDKATKTYGPGFYAAYQAVHAPDDDPTRITDPQQLYSQVGPHGDLTVAGVDKLRSDLAARGTPEGVAAGKIQAGVMDYAKRQLSFDADYGSFKVLDPKGEDAFNIGFTPAFFKYWNDGIKAGKSPAELADQASIDKIIAPFKRTPAQLTQDRLAGDDAAIALPPPVAGTQQNFDTVPPALNTRVPGQTTAVTPRGKFMWQADGWHPIQ